MAGWLGGWLAAPRVRRTNALDIDNQRRYVYSAMEVETLRDRPAARDADAVRRARRPSAHVLTV